MKRLFLFSFVAILVVSCSKNASDTSTVAQPAQALSGTFRISSDDISENQGITFTPVDSRSGNTYFWDLGIINGQKISTSKTAPVITFRMHGNYTIKLTVTDSKGNSVSSTQVVPVTCNFFGAHAGGSPEIN